MLSIQNSKRSPKRIARHCSQGRHSANTVLKDKIRINIDVVAGIDKKVIVPLIGDLIARRSQDFVRIKPAGMGVLKKKRKLSDRLVGDLKAIVIHIVIDLA